LEKSKERKRTMKKVLLTILALVVVLGLFAATGYVGYRFGYAQGAQGAQLIASGDAPRPRFRPFDEVIRPRMPMHNFGREIERGFNRGIHPDGFRRMGFGFFSPILFLGSIALLGLALWFIYWLFTRSGWRLTRMPPAAVTTSQDSESGNQNVEADQ
jgi:hypothetical protein